MKGDRDDMRNADIESFATALPFVREFGINVVAGGAPMIIAVDDESQTA